MAEANTLADVYRDKVTLVIGDDFLCCPKGSLQMEQDLLLAHSMMAEQANGIHAQIANKEILQVKIDRAELVKNYGFTKMDPYCKLKIGGRVYETPTCYGASTKPIWNREFRCPIDENVKSFLIEIMDENQFYSDSRIAYTNVKITQDVFSCESPKTFALPLSGEQGQEKEGTLFIQVNVFRFQSMLPASASNPESSAVNGISKNISDTPAEAVIHVPTEEEMKMLSEMFPSVETEAIKSVIRANDGNMERSINSLLTISVREPSPLDEGAEEDSKH